MIGAFCLTAFVVNNAYSGTLISYLTVPKLLPVTKSLDELATQRYQNVLLLTEKNEEIAQMFLVNIFLSEIIKIINTVFGFCRQLLLDQRN